MLVKDLIQKLQEFDENEEVYVRFAIDAENLMLKPNGYYMGE